MSGLSCVCWLSALVAMLGAPPAQGQQPTQQGRSLGFPLYNTTWFSFTPGDRVPVNLSNYSDGVCISASNSLLELVDVARGSSTLIAPPEGIDLWNPTATVYHPHRQLLYVANFGGRDVLITRLDRQRRLTLVRRITHPQMQAPSGVDVSPDGSRIAVADYLGNTVYLFQQDGACLWKRPVNMPYSVCFAHDHQSVIATCLYSRELVRFTADGQESLRRGKQGWWKDEYLWPTGISAISRGRYLVADAHTGQLSVLNGELEEIQTLAGNGPGMGLMNMPYHAIEASNGNFLVADTYKNRVVRIDPHHGEVLNAVYCDGSNPLRRTGQYNRQMYAPIGRGYVSYINRAQDVHLGRFIPGLNNGAWHVGYNLMVSNGKHVTTEGPPQIVGFDSYYFVQAAEVALDDGDSCLVMGSPQRARWLVIHDGVFATVPLQNNLWIAGDQLAGDFATWKLTTIAQHGMVKIRNYQRSTLADPYERVGKMLFADVPYDEFIQAMPTFFVTAAGKQLYQEVRSDQPNFAAYYAAMSEQEGVPLLEFCFVNALQAVWP